MVCFALVLGLSSLALPGVASPEDELAAKLPEVFAKAAAHYRALDAAATPLRKGEMSKRAGRHNGDLYTPHGFSAKTGKLDMRSIYWWTAGHFPGSLWYLYEATGDAFFRDRAADALERAGCILKTKDPQYQVEVRFEGPYSEDGDGWASFGWMVCTIFTADYNAVNWNAKLRIHDLASGKLVYAKDFVERDEAVVWGPIPIFSPAGSDRNSNAVMKQICLMALTDKAVAEALSFFSGR